MKGASRLQSYIIIGLLTLFTIFVIIIIQTGFSKKSLPNIGQQPQNQIKELNISVCDPANGSFTLNIDNPYFPLPVGMVQIIEDPKEKVQISVLDQTEVVAEINTRVVEEREWIHGELAEVSRNYYAQTPDGTVCYYGEDVDDYTEGEVVSHSGSWRAGEGNSKPGIIMPANPQVGQKYQQETVPHIADDRARHIAFEPSFTTPAGTFKNVLLVEEKMTYEIPNSYKRYAKGVGLIFDDGMMLTKY